MVNGITDYLARPRQKSYHGGQGQAASRLPAMSEPSGWHKFKIRGQAQVPVPVSQMDKLKLYLYDEGFKLTYGQLKPELARC